MVHFRGFLAVLFYLESLPGLCFDVKPRHAPSALKCRKGSGCAIDLWAQSLLQQTKQKSLVYVHEDKQEPPPAVVAPVAPVAAVAPVVPVAPVAEVAPVVPVAPVAAVAPGNTTAPATVAPVAPDTYDGHYGDYSDAYDYYGGWSYYIPFVGSYGDYYDHYDGDDVYDYYYGGSYWFNPFGDYYYDGDELQAGDQVHTFDGWGTFVSLDSNGDAAVHMDFCDCEHYYRVADVEKLEGPAAAVYYADYYYSYWR